MRRATERRLVGDSHIYRSQLPRVAPLRPAVCLSGRCGPRITRMAWSGCCGSWRPPRCSSGRGAGTPTRRRGCARPRIDRKGPVSMRMAVNWFRCKAYFAKSHSIGPNMLRSDAFCHQSGSGCRLLQGQEHFSPSSPEWPPFMRRASDCRASDESSPRCKCKCA